MNTTYPIAYGEPRWRTYGKALIFALPAVTAWWFACLFLFPRALWIFRQAGFDPAQLAWLWEPPWFLVRHGVAVAVGLIALLALLEWFGRSWPRYRRVTLAVLVWLANGTVFFGLTALLILIMLAAPLLPRGP